MTEHEMNEHETQQIREMLQQALPAVDTELRRDLWPAVWRKLDQRPAPAPWYRAPGFSVPRFSVPWYDWALIGLTASVFVFFPHLILVCAYHL